MMQSIPTSRVPNRFLFLLPASTTPSEQDVVASAAQELTPLGYVYIASAHVPTMEDRGDIRFMPLRDGTLPCFGAVTGVMIARDQELVRVAQENYPGAQVVVFDPAQSPQRITPDEFQLPMRATTATRRRGRGARGMVPQAA
jgi:hypothetical protein